MKRWLILLAVISASVFAACSSPGTGSMGGMDDAAAGGPGDPASVDRVVEIQMMDALAYDPASVSVGVGETVKFNVTNTGTTDHEFVLGDQAKQDDHEAQMAGSSMSMGESNVLKIAPGETGSLVWTFTAAGTLLYACHEPAHYAGGMVGMITVT